MARYRTRVVQSLTNGIAGPAVPKTQRLVFNDIQEHRSWNDLGGPLWYAVQGALQCESK